MRSFLNEVCAAMTDFTSTLSDIDVNETTGVVRRLSGT
jgi:hypothetical protein